MKSLLIFVLVLALAAAAFFTRPTSEDFKRYVRENTQIVDGKPTGGQTVLDKIGDKLKTFSAGAVNRSAADIFLEQVEYDNYYLWTNVKKDGQVIYTGAFNHWFERSAAKTASAS